LYDGTEAAEGKNPGIVVLERKANRSLDERSAVVEASLPSALFPRNRDSSTPFDLRIRAARTALRM